MELLSVIRRWHYRDHMPIREIERRTARRLHADLVVLGYDGSYARVAAFVRHWRADRDVAQRTTGRGVFVPLAFRLAMRFSSTGARTGR